MKPKPAAVWVPNIDDVLGPSAERFFGVGYRRVAQRIVSLSWVDGPGGKRLVGTAALEYPGDWSRKSRSRELQPHVSSIDALALSIRLLETYLSAGYGPAASHVSRAWLRGYEMRSGTEPTLDLNDIPLGLRVAAPAVPTESGGYVSSFDCTVGPIKVRCHVGHDDWADSATRPHGAPLIPTAPFHAKGYRDRSYDIADVNVDVAALAAAAAVEVRPETGCGGEGELGGAYQPTVTAIDAIIVLAQLAQALLYGIDELTRGETNTLWMRRIEMSRDHPRQPLGATLRCTARIDRLSIVTLDGASWRTSTISSDFGGMRLRYALAHQLPDRKI